MSLRLKFWLITLGALLAAGVTFALGQWQLSRAAQKEAYQARVEAQGSLPQLDAKFLLGNGDLSADIHRGVVLRGQWLAARTVYLDNRQMNSKVGLYVVTPLRLEGATGVVLIQRGWVARNFIDRNALTPIETPSGIVEIQGRIAPPPSKLYELGSSERGLIRQNLDMRQFSAELGEPLVPVSVQQLGPASEGLLREWPVVGSGVEKHYGYAFQWFALSALISILYVWFQIVRRFKQPQRG